MRGIASVFLLLGLPYAAAAAEAAPDAAKILRDSGVTGGLVVHLGCGDGTLTAALRKNDSYLVQGLDADAGNVAAAKENIRACGAYGPVTVKHWPHAHLPYADGVVNLLVVSADRSAVSQQEIERVLAPGGVKISLQPSASTLPPFEKPWPEDVDEWTHYLHDASGNAVANDLRVSPPRSLQWNGGPKYSRNHEIDSSVVAAVSARGRLFYILDEGPAGMMGKRLPQTWALAARDAFSGVVLWKRPVPEMGWPEWKPELADADWSKLIAQRRLIPISLPRRLVAVGERVYVTFGYDAPLSILDAASGETIETCDGTQGTDEILWHDDTLVLCVRPETREAQEPEGYDGISRNDNVPINNAGIVMALDAEGGRILWQSKPTEILPLSLTVGGDRIFYHNGEAVVCLDKTTGRQHWTAANDNAAAFRWNVRHTLVAHEDVLLVGTSRKLDAFSAESGGLLWSGKGGRGGFGGANPTNVYVARGMVWVPKGGNSVQGLDPLTGEVKRDIPLPPYMYTAGHHVRCYRGKATERYLLENKRGIEMIDLKAESHVKHDWIRGICRYGVLPCNGLIYSTPTPCSCYPTVQLHGFNALSGGRDPATAKSKTDSELRMTGSAFGSLSKFQPLSPEAWPTLRGGPMRHGVSPTTISAQITPQWSTNIGGRLTQPVVADGRLFLASIDEQTVHALDAATGKCLWSYTASARVDSPPTYHNGMVLFGCRDGWVYNLRAADGELVWGYRVAPADDQIVSYGQVESIWPVHGSVLVVDDIMYGAAGRNSYLDGGIRLVGLDVATGEKLHEGHVRHDPQDPAVDRGAAHVMEGAKTDVLASDGRHIFMQSAVFDMTLKQVPDGSQDSRHIYATAGYLDDLAWNRNAWQFAKTWPTVNKKALAVPHTGQLLVHDGSLTYGVKYFLVKTGQSMVFYPGQRGYYLFSDAVETGDPKKLAKTKRAKKAGDDGPKSSLAKWDAWVPVRIRAMVKTADTLFFAGPPDVVDPKDPLAAFEGRGDAVLIGVSAEDGKQLGQLALDSPPVFDGMVAANGKLYLSTCNGNVLCITGNE